MLTNRLILLFQVWEELKLKQAMPWLLLELNRGVIALQILPKKI